MSFAGDESARRPRERLRSFNRTHLCYPSNEVLREILHRRPVSVVTLSQQGGPQDLFDERGQLVWQGTFDDWDKLTAETGSTTCRLRLPGQIADDETGLHYNRFRYYSPDAGQFVSADPIGFAGGTNEYRSPPMASIGSIPRHNGHRARLRGSGQVLGAIRRPHGRARRRLSGSKFEFTVLDRATAGTALDVAEESWMRAGGSICHQSIDVTLQHQGNE